jgi:hypothetical protein
MTTPRLTGSVGGLGALGLVTLVLPLVLAGCGSSKATVTGKISYKGEPLGNGRIMFINQKDPTKAGAGSIQPDGTYTVPDAPVGPATITVETIPTAAAAGGGSVGAKSGELAKPPAGMNMPMPGAGGGGGGKYVKIPDKYKTKEQSGQTYDVKAGKQEHDIDLPP